jgi:flagellar biosynthesis/type III secretory pathway M-ring protein FliF/YscJ
MKAFYTLLTVLALNLIPALAANITLTTSGPLKAGQETTITANVTQAQGLEGAVVSVIIDGAQDSEAQQLELGKIGDPKLEATIKPLSDVVHVTVRYSKNGKNYANVANIQDLQTNSYEFRFDQEASRASTPIIQYGLWLLVFAALGAFALRHTKSAF